MFIVWFWEAEAGDPGLRCLDEPRGWSLITLGGIWLLTLAWELLFVVWTLLILCELDTLLEVDWEELFTLLALLTAVCIAADAGVSDATSIGFLEDTGLTAGELGNVAEGVEEGEDGLVEGWFWMDAGCAGDILDGDCWPGVVFWGFEGEDCNGELELDGLLVWLPGVFWLGLGLGLPPGVFWLGIDGLLGVDGLVTAMLSTPWTRGWFAFKFWTLGLTGMLGFIVSGLFTSCAMLFSALLSWVWDNIFPWLSITVSLTDPSGFVTILTVSPGFCTVDWLLATYSATRIVPSSLIICPSLIVVTVLFWAGNVNVPFC